MNRDWTFVHASIADKDVVEKIFTENDIAVVVNLAAQAGVRYSITNPDAYIQSNLIGFYNILETCRHHEVEHLVYASSSSVYGSNKKVPYSTDDKVDNPVSLYAATKKSNELMAHAYSKLYNIPSTGLRFFTVYGPAGRPDMAYFSFTDKLVKGGTIKIFNYGNCKRDFTYVDDIVEGVVRIMQHAPEKQNGEDGLPIPPYKVYNIGNSHPENLLEFVTILQEELLRAGVLPENYDFEAHKELVPMQPGDVPVTYADTTPLEQDFGFKPNTSLREGLRHFTEWYVRYYKNEVKQVKYKTMSIFAGKTLMITGGTGSFGNAVLNRFLRTDIGEIRIFSRDEKKQDDMRHEYQSKYPDVANKIKFFIGDVRDIQSCRNAMPGVDYIFHAAALKQVPSCEFFPMEAVKTNVIGTDNILTAAIEAGVGAVICLSTDKAAYPINAMGISKAIEEKVAVAKSRYSGKTKICCTRYGNVMCSRGSVIPLWIDQIRNGNPITLTEPKMTRFIMSLEEAVDLVLFAFEHGQNGDILVQKAPACTIQIQAEAVCELFGGKKEDIKVIGIRHGEKMYETLLTKEECAKAEDMGNFYRVPADNRGLNYDKYFKEGDTKRSEVDEFNSNNAYLLSLEETKAKIASLDYIKKELSGEGNFIQ